VELTLDRWHERFQQQAAWTRQLRTQLLADLDLGPESRILDLGSGTGALFPDLSAANPGRTFGADIDLSSLQFAAARSPGIHLAAGDGRALPFQDGSFELVLCHFTLLWIADPFRVVEEMVRVAAPGGTIAALAEPDYGGRIDYPEALGVIRKLQLQSLADQGADPRMGRKLPGVFRAAGLQDVRTGVYQGAWSGRLDPADIRREWEFLRHDLDGLISPEALDELRDADQQARREGRRVLFVPTFYALGAV
jgi:SAM-dependent methyltransferase